MENKLYIPSILRFVKWILLTIDWPKMILLKSGLIKGDIVLRLRNGLKLTLINKKRDSDTAVLADIYFNHPYTKNEFDIKEGDIVVDIGANVGIFSTYIAINKKNLKVFAYEPNHKNFEYLKKNIEQNNLQGKIKVFNFAITDKLGKIKLYLHDRGSGGHSIYKKLVSSKNGYFVEVKSISLKDIFTSNKLNKIDFLKIDCEGAEYKILFNTPKKFLKNIKKISLEYHQINGFSGEDLKEFLSNNGFKVRLENGILQAQRM